MPSENITGIIQHKALVASYMQQAASELFKRAAIHDNSKFDPEEFDLFEEMTPLLKTLEYGSEEYKQSLAELKPALDHHYAVNSHHPEFYQDGINGMNLIDLIEMVCDWLAATQRTKGGDIYKSLDINQQRFAIGPQLAGILENTIDQLLYRKRLPNPNTLYPDMLTSEAPEGAYYQERKGKA